MRSQASEIWLRQELAMHKNNTLGLLDVDIIYPLISKALEISNFMFLKYLTESGVDGQPFIDKKELSLLINVTGQIGLKVKKDSCFEDRGSQITDYYINKIIKLYNHWGRINKSGKKKILQKKGARAVVKS